MKIKFSAILTAEKSLKAVESNGDALQYVLVKEWFISIAKKFLITIDL